jgi:DNA-binding response OmpR family regulator
MTPPDMNRSVVVLDDEEDIRTLLDLQLGNAGFRVTGFAEPEPFFAHLRRHTPDLIILDLMLPGMDGICKVLKANETWRRIPVVMLTARDEETDKVLGLEMGADDYITKPFSSRELVARIKAVLRRPAPSIQAGKIDFGASGVLDMENRDVLIGGKRLDLTATEYRILAMLVRHKGRVFSRDEILDQLWGSERIVTDRTIDVHIRNLRMKLGNEGTALKNVRGMGYKWEI